MGTFRTRNQSPFSLEDTCSCGKPPRSEVRPRSAAHGPHRALAPGRNTGSRPESEEEIRGCRRGPMSAPDRQAQWVRPRRFGAPTAQALPWESRDTRPAAPERSSQVGMCPRGAAASEANKLALSSGRGAAAAGAPGTAHAGLWVWSPPQLCHRVRPPLPCAASVGEMCISAAKAAVPTGHRWASRPVHPRRRRELL